MIKDIEKKRDEKSQEQWMVHAYDPNSHEFRQSYHNLKVSLAYTANTKQIRAT